MDYIYFLHLDDEKIYTGRTKDLQRRMAEHYVGKVASTKHRRPLELLGYEAYQLSSDAMRRERYLKTTEGKRLLRQQYRDIIGTIRKGGRAVYGARLESVWRRKSLVGSNPTPSASQR